MMRKDSVTVYSEDQFLNASSTCDIQSPSYIDTIKRKVKENVTKEFSDMWVSHVKTLAVQGNFLELLNVERSHITWRSLIYNLPNMFCNLPPMQLLILYKPIQS